MNAIELKRIWVRSTSSAKGRKGCNIFKCKLYYMFEILLRFVYSDEFQSFFGNRSQNTTNTQSQPLLHEANHTIEPAPLHQQHLPESGFYVRLKQETIAHIDSPIQTVISFRVSDTLSSFGTTLPLAKLTRLWPSRTKSGKKVYWMQGEFKMYRFVNADNIKELTYHINSGRRFVRAIFTFRPRQDASLLSLVLRKNKTIFKLLLNGAMLDDVDGAQILDSIHKHPTLDLIDLIRNDLGPQSSLKIASLVKENRILKEYYFRDNQLQMDGIRSALENLERNFVVTYFDISGNADIPESAVERVQELLERNREKEKEAFTKALQLKSNSKAGWQRSKLMVVGQGRAGKTATVNSLLGKTFDPKWDSTIGIQQTEVVSQEDKWRPTRKARKGDNALKFAARVAEKHIRMGSFQESEKSESRRKSTLSLDLESDNGETEGVATQKMQIKNPTNVEKVQGDRDGDGDENQQEQLHENGQVAAEESEVTAKFMKNYKHDFRIKAQTRRDALSVSVWDYGGQKVFYTLHHLFMTNYGIYLLVFSIPQLLESAEKSMEYLKFWINSIQLHAANAPIVIAGTSLCNLEEKNGMERLNELFAAADLNRYNQVMLNAQTSQPFFCIDNKYDVGVKALRTTVRQLFKRQDHVNFQVSIKWMHCLDQIKELNKDWLPIGKVTELAESCAITSASEQREMLHLFHELGVLIHFTRTQSLADVVTVRPQWLVDEISKVIRDPSIHKFDASVMASVGLEPDIKRLFDVGIASEDLIDYLWSRHSKNFLLDLMRSLLLLSDWDFDRTNTNAQNHYLIPSMIAATRDSNQVSGLKATFDFSSFFLPDGLFERLVCLCVQHSAYLKGSKTPVLTQTHCTIWLGEKDVIVLSRVDNVIQLNILRSAIAANVLTVIHSMFRKLKDEAMGSRLKWQSFLQVEDELMPYEDAKAARVKPWFQSASPSKELARNVEQFDL